MDKKTKNTKVAGGNFTLALRPIFLKTSKEEKDFTRRGKKSANESKRRASDALHGHPSFQILKKKES